MERRQCTTGKWGRRGRQPYASQQSQTHAQAAGKTTRNGLRHDSRELLEENIEKA